MLLSWKIFTAFGIPVKLHFSMLLIPFLASSWVSIGGIGGMLLGGIIAVLLFGSVLLHELGHALTGRRFGVHTEDIVLTPIGGMARMRAIPTNPLQEIAIAAAGPGVSLGLALAFRLLYAAIAPDNLAGALMALVFDINIMLGVFNLIPALPMDGGRILRGALALKHSHLRATEIASKIGKALAVTGIVLALYIGSVNALNDAPGGFNTFIPIVICLFVYNAAGQELRVARLMEHHRRQQQAYPAAAPPGWHVHHQTDTSGEYRQATGRNAYRDYNTSPRTSEWHQRVPTTDVKKVDKGRVVVVDPHTSDNGSTKDD